MNEQIERIAERRLGLVDDLKGIIIENLDLDLERNEIDEDCALFGVGLGLDSIDALQLVLSVEKQYDLTLPTDDITIYRSINSLADFIQSHEGAR